MSVPSEPSANDEDLIAQLQAGDPDAFETLLDRYLHHLHLFVALKSPISDWVDPITREALAFAFQNADLYHSSTSLRSWLEAIAWKLICIRAQKQRRRPKLESYLYRLLNRIDHEHLSTHDSSEVECFTTGLRALPERAADLLSLKYAKGETMETIAFLTDRQPAAVRMMLFRIRQQLHTDLKNLEDRREEIPHVD